MKRNDIAVGLYILAAIMFLIIPMSPYLLDFFLALNISIAMVILFNAMFTKEILNMSAFPTIILFTTIFRIALNVSSTRLILSTGNPGKVVKTFGEFVGGNNLIIGLIIFIVLIMVQFIVINKGSERVAEVTARFTLDAMPGKQMAIDADLNTGAITDKEAMERRQKIQDESAFFGSMDGATKYVKGDAIAGLIVTVINMVGGTVTGMLNQGLQAGEAFQEYAILTIGDGLVSQIPSLMISLATGILVTKVSKEADFGDMLIEQLFSIPRALYIVGISMIVLGIVTPLNIFLFTGYGLAFIFSARAIEEKLEVESIESEVSLEEEEANEIRKPENV
ncbi:MAG: FHIPEP family type III secretion protein, partial [Clostridiales bacterium]|nr:FHIPEP family type III secretion protein [Clostridiales bacterium]